jgi:hypothetical protein
MCFAPEGLEVFSGLGLVEQRTYRIIKIHQYSYKTMAYNATLGYYL